MCSSVVNVTAIITDVVFLKLNWAKNLLLVEDVQLSVWKTMWVSRVHYHHEWSSFEGNEGQWSLQNTCLFLNYCLLRISNGLWGWSLPEPQVECMITRLATQCQRLLPNVKDQTYPCYGVFWIFVLNYCLCVCPHTLRLQIVELGLEDPVAEKRGENLGFIRLFIRVSRSTEDDSLAPQCLKKSSGKERGAHLWSKVLNVTLLEGKGLPAMDDNGERVCWCLW